MEPTLAWSELANLPVVGMQDVLRARFIGRDEAAKLGFPSAMLTRIATVISEITRNVLEHSGTHGNFRLAKAESANRRGLRIVVSDSGRGIERPDRFLEETSGGNRGAGLLGSRQLTDKFTIQTMPDQGTIVSMEIWTCLAD